ncbi:MAG: hypothetical protein COY85_04550 [Candidatus Portnoybacteria bacterium CG_4_10_14_0_8_um_filter_40_50]|uniref:Uncharacterized protein n=1 Tax=Candidatus Portnoybacteria bacterium CG_4_10_14_0_8_um_filter_40_50 TaxID=1974800 RepID=A0A2M7QQ47_9BACT|nr:MAG: hypothetical protein COY85_04550 [Candidatus Portnoybacteria bacterium CG_4_10_14_0_8_um_filter_40_50]
MVFLNKEKIIGSPAKRARRAGKKEGGWGEGIFARPPRLGWEAFPRFCVSRISKQKNFRFLN